MREMIEALKKIHKENEFEKNGGENIIFRMNLIMEEVGEICACITKRNGNIKEEHADLLILLLGNCIALDIDIESEFWRKIEKMRGYRTVNYSGYNRLTSD